MYVHIGLAVERGNDQVALCTGWGRMAYSAYPWENRRVAGQWEHVPDAPREGIARPSSEWSFHEQTAVYKVYQVEPVMS